MGGDPAPHAGVDLELAELADHHQGVSSRVDGPADAHADARGGGLPTQYVLTWEKLSVSTKPGWQRKESKTLLLPNSGTIDGGLWAIMGASGSGKTTFLLALALRLDAARMRVEGEMRLNGRKYCKQTLKSMAAYVMQDDLLNAPLTVDETMSYTAELRMPASTPAAERVARQEHLINLLGLTHCRHVMVGDHRHKGISGGERKRLCIAMELITRPALLFLDEPTSGLDSHTALSVVETLKKIAEVSEATVVTTIHQPSSKIFSLFDKLIMMEAGRVEYQGSAPGALAYYAGKGFPAASDVNPADHLIDVMRAIGDQRALESPETAKRSRSDRHLELDFGISTNSANPGVREWLPWHRQFSVLFRRCNKLHVRESNILLVNVLVTVLVSFFTCMSVWRDMGTHKESAAKRMPALFFCVIHQGIVSSLQGTHSFPLERALMLRERAAGSYYVSAYFLAKSASDFCWQVISPILFTCIVYPVIGFAASFRQFFIFMGFMVLGSQAATSMSNMTSCLCVSIELSTVVLAGLYEISRLYGGWFISPRLMASYEVWRFADALSYIKYTFVGVALNENDGLLLTCLPSERTPPNDPGPQTPQNCRISPLSPNYYPYSGENFNKFYGYDEYSIGLCAGALVAYIVACRLIAYLALRYIKT